MKKKVLILFGGRSFEHDISIISTFQCLKYFDEYLYDLVLVYIDQMGKWKLVKDSSSLNKFLKDRESLKEVQLGANEDLLYIKKSRKYKPLCKVDVVFPIMHGINGEDGNIMGLLQMSNIPFVGCNYISSAIGIDKSLFKKVMRRDRVLPMVELCADDILDGCGYEKVKKEIGFPCIIKPNKLGSSIGIEKCEDDVNFNELVKKSLKFDEKVVIEPYISNLREFNIALYKIGGEFVVSEIEEPFSSEEILSFKDKYLNYSDQYVAKNIPAKIGKTIKDKIVLFAKECYDLLKCRGVVRVDFMYDKSVKKLYVNEINTIPGALALYLFEAAVIDRKTVVNDVINESFRVFQNDREMNTKYDSLVLRQGGLSKFNKE